MKKAKLFVALILMSGAVFGQKSGKTYNSPLHNFSITVPDFPFGTKVYKSNDNIRGWVAFSGGAGDMARIGYQRLDIPIPNINQAVNLDSVSYKMLKEMIAGLDTMTRDGLLKNLFQQFYGMSSDSMVPHSQIPDSVLLDVATPAYFTIENYQQQVMARFNGRILSREPLVLDSTLMVFTVAVSQEASDNIDMATGKHMDVVFGHMAFIRGGFFYNLKVEPNSFATQLAKTSNPSETLAQINRRLIKQLYRSIAFR